MSKTGEQNQELANGKLPTMADIENDFMSDEEVQEEKKSGPVITREDRPGRSRGKEIKGPAVRFYNEDNKFLKKRPAQLQGLSEMMLPPITKRRLATYEVVNKDLVDPLTKEVIDTPPLILPGKYIIYDPFQEDVLNRHVLLKNISRRETTVRGGREEVEEIVEDIVFPNGAKSVVIDKNYLQYALLELHPLNASNKYRDQSQAPAFRRTDMGLRKDWVETQAGMDLAFEAEQTVVNMKNGDDIIRYATAAGIPTAGRMLDAGDSSVKRDLRLFARNDPRGFFKLNKTNNAAIKMAVMEAIDLGLVEYFVDRRRWLFSTDGADAGQHLPGQEPVEALIKLLQSEDYLEVYKKLQSQLNYWE